MPRAARPAPVTPLDPATVASLIERVERAETRVKALELALRPFGVAAAALDSRNVESDERRWPGEIPMPTVSELRRARAALEGK